MQQITNTDTDAPDMLPCLLIPIQGGRMVLPNVTIAELITFQKPSKINNSPDWIIGEIEWRGTMIPIVSYEDFSGFKKGPAGQDLRVAVVNSPNGEHGKMRFFGLLTQGLPSLIKLEEAAIKENTNIVLQKGQKMAVTLETGHATIPDLDMLESAILAAM
jgi:chemosensory pili system protein ChpC